MNFSGKAGHPNIQPWTRLGIELGTSRLVGRYLTTAPTPPLYYMGQLVIPQLDGGRHLSLRMIRYTCRWFTVSYISKHSQQNIHLQSFFFSLCFFLFRFVYVYFVCKNDNQKQVFSSTSSTVNVVIDFSLLHITKQN